MDKQQRRLEQLASPTTSNHASPSEIPSTSPDLSRSDDSALQLPVRPARPPRFADLDGETMTPELIMQYRARIAAGVYDRPALIRALADAMLESGDI
ncbi:MAG: hypothetical protein U0163_09800 [Gemmatimonadaceae bacterium]